MNDFQSKSLLAVSMLAILSLSPLSVAQQGQTPQTQPPKSETAAPEKQKQSPKGQEEGVNVHGHWTIEIRNPDGSLAGRHEFENYLAPVGKKLLTAILTRTGTMMQWDVRLIATGPSCSPVLTNISYCALEEPIPGKSDDGTSFYNLKVSIPSSGDRLSLSGSAQISGTGQIYQVSTGVWYCTPDHALGSCPPLLTVVPGTPPPAGGDFTIANPPPINVQPGQTLLITVSFTFS